VAFVLRALLLFASSAASLRSSLGWVLPLCRSLRSGLAFACCLWSCCPLC
jgi:hypothetical protein